MGSLRVAFYAGMILSFVAAVISMLRGEMYIDRGARYVAEMDEVSEDPASPGNETNTEHIFTNHGRGNIKNSPVTSFEDSPDSIGSGEEK